jgi:hypothetical protein
MGVGLALRRKGVLTWRAGANGIAIDRPRRPVRVPWVRIAALEETPEFFLVRLPSVGYYLPKRALGGPEREAEWRRVLFAGASSGDGAAGVAPDA